MNICLCNQALVLFICCKQPLAVQQALVSQLPFVLIALYFHTSALLAARARFLRSFPASQHLPREASASSHTQPLLPLGTLSRGWFPACESPTWYTTTSLLPSPFCTPSSGQESKQESKRRARGLRRVMGVQSGCVSFWMSLGIFPLWLVCCPHRGVGYGFQVLSFAPGQPLPQICWWSLFPCPAPSKICPSLSTTPPCPSSRGSDPVGYVYVCQDEREPKCLLPFSCVLNCSPGRGFRLWIRGLLKLKAHFLTSNLVRLPSFPISALLLFQENFLTESSAGAAEP